MAFHHGTVRRMHCKGIYSKAFAIVIMLAGCGDDSSTKDMDAGGVSGGSQSAGGSMTGGSSSFAGGTITTGGGGASGTAGAGDGGSDTGGGGAGGMAGMDATGGSNNDSDAGTDCEWDIGTQLDYGKENLNMCTACKDDTSCDAPSYTDNGDGTVSSSCCGLVWQQVVDEAGGSGSGVGQGHYTFPDAEAYCAGLTLAGGGWRIPTIEELYSLVLLGQTPAEPVIDRTAFPNTPVFYYWSSTITAPDIGSGDFVWYVNFYSGNTSATDTISLHNVRCVR